MSTQKILARGDVRRARRRLNDLTAWLTSANGNHAPHIDRQARRDIVALQTLLSQIGN